jgi:hypothetical protein
MANASYNFDSYETITYNGTTIKEVKFNGTSMWSAPSSGFYSSMVLSNMSAQDLYGVNPQAIQDAVNSGATAVDMGVGLTANTWFLWNGSLWYHPRSGVSVSASTAGSTRSDSEYTYYNTTTFTKAYYVHVTLYGPTGWVSTPYNIGDLIEIKPDSSGNIPNQTLKVKSPAVYVAPGQYSTGGYSKTGSIVEINNNKIRWWSKSLLGMASSAIITDSETKANQSTADTTMTWNKVSGFAYYAGNSQTNNVWAYKHYHTNRIGYRQFNATSAITPWEKIVEYKA